MIKVFGSYRKMPLENLSNIRRLIWKIMERDPESV